MASTRVLTGLIIVTALSVAPLSADQGRRRGDGDRGRERSSAQADQGRQRAVPRARAADRQVDRQNEQRQQQNEQRQQQQVQRQEQAQRQQQQVQRQEQAQRQQQIQRQNDTRQYQAQRQYDNRQYQAQRQYEARGQYEAQRRRETDRRYDTRGDYGRPSYSNRGYGYGRAVPRIIRPTIVTVIPYRRYAYRPRLSIGVYYGAGGSYPYGYTPRGYYDPIPGRLYGGLRITGAPHEAHVFADGYYVGIVDDFDGVFQHLNLEAGPHRIEVEVPGYESIAFDVMVQPGRTTTFRADLY
jgi:hypothetical protein